MAATVITNKKFSEGHSHVRYVSGSFVAANDSGDAVAYTLTDFGRLQPASYDPHGLGFRPRKVKVTQVYLADGSTIGLKCWEWFDGMSNDSALETLLSTGAVTLITSNAVKVEGKYPYSDSYSAGDYDKDAAITPSNNFGNVNTPGQQPDHNVTLGTGIVTANGTYFWECWG